MAKRSAAVKAYTQISFRDCTINEILKDRESGKQKRLKKGDEDKFRKLSRYYFESRSIGENRDDGRRIGIDSPCAYPKAELIDKIMDTVWGLQYFGEHVDAVVEPSIDRINEDAELDILEVFGRGKFVIGELVTGIFDGDECGGVLHVDKFNGNARDAAVIRGIVNSYGLKSGDILSARMHYDKKLSFFCVHYVDEINGVKTETFEKLKPTKKNPYVEPPAPVVKPRIGAVRFGFSGSPRLGLAAHIDAFSPVLMGQAALVSASGKMDFADKAASLAKIAEGSGTFDETLLYITGENEETIKKTKKIFPGLTTIGKSIHDNDRVMVRRMCDYAVRRAECGQHIMLIVEDLDAVSETACDAARLLESARRTETGGSVTVVVFADIDSTLSKYYIVRRLASAELRVVSRPFFSDYVVDALNCSSDAAEAFTEEEKLADEALKKTVRENGSEAAMKVVDDCGSYPKFVKYACGNKEN